MSAKPVIVAAGQTRFGDHVEWGVKELFASSLDDLEASGDMPIDRGRIQAAFIGSLSAGQGAQLGNFAPALTDYAALDGIPAVHVESACASGSYALHAAIQAVASGQYDCVLASGVEKMRDVSGHRGKYWLGISGDTEYERLAGVTFAGVFALIASRVIEEGIIDRADLARIAVKNHRNGVHNPIAQFRREVSMDDVLSAQSVASPLGALDCCPTTDGAASVLVTSERVAKEFTSQPVTIAGWGSASDTLALHSRRDLTRLTAVESAARQAYAMADVTPRELDLVEAHDCFTIAEVLAYLSLGLTTRENVSAAIRAGEFERGGRIPVNPSGGLKSKGHPIGATGIAQVVELHRQLRGEARSHERQISGADIGLAQNVGGSGSSATVTILRRSS